MTRARLLRAVVALSLCAGPVRAQAPAVVPASDPAYHDIDRLVVAGLVDTIIVGQRPYSRREIARIVREAARRATARDGASMPPALRETLADLEARFHDDLAPGPWPRRPAAALLDRADVFLTTTDEVPRLVPPDTGIGGVDAIIAPLAQGAQAGAGGRDVARGTTLALETVHELALGDHIALAAHPRLRVSSESFTGEPTLALHTLAARFRASNVVVAVGRDEMVWGQSRRATLFLSGNARPLDMIRLASDRPWVMPGFLRALGPTALSFFVADLGPRQYFPHTKLVGYKWSLEPSRDLELAATALDFVGGRGAPSASFGKKVKNLFLFPFLPTEGYQFSNTMAGLEARYRARSLGGAQLYWEMNLDDFDLHRIASSVWTDDGAHVFGLSVPEIGADARAAVTLELHHTGTRFNRHQQFLSGPTLDRVLLGEPLGPDASGGYAFVDWEPRRATTVGIELAEEVYRNDQYTLTYQPFTFHLLERRPEERRHRAMLTLRDARAARGPAVTLQLGLERVTNFAFAEGAARTQALGSIGMSYTLR